MKNPYGLDVYNLGEFYCYMYHTGNLPNVSCPRDMQTITKCWFPVTKMLEELFILKRIYDTCGGHDGQLCSLDVPRWFEETWNNYFSISSLLYLTAERNYCFDVEREMNCDKNVAENRWKQRHSDFLQKNLVLGDGVSSIGLTFSGVERMERLLSLDDKDRLVKYIDESLTYMQDLTNLLTDLQDNCEFMIKTLQNIESDTALTVLDGMNAVNNFCSILGIVVSAVTSNNPLVSSLSKFLNNIVSLFMPYRF